MHVNLEKVTSYTKHVFHEWDMKIMLTKVSNTSLMFNMNHGGDKMLLMGSTATHRNFHITGLLHYVNNAIVLVRPKDVMVYARWINHE